MNIVLRILDLEPGLFMQSFAERPVPGATKQTQLAGANPHAQDRENDYGAQQVAENSCFNA
jgi:hypothetical protein